MHLWADIKVKKLGMILVQAQKVGNWIEFI